MHRKLPSVPEPTDRDLQPPMTGAVRKSPGRLLRETVSAGILLASAALLWAPNAHAEDAPDDPAAYWSFNSDFSATAGGSQYDGTPIAGASIDPWRSRFDTASVRLSRQHGQYVEIGNFSLPTDQDHTYAAWYYLDIDGIAGGDRYAVIETAPNWSISYGLRLIDDEDRGQVFTHDDGDDGGTPNMSFASGNHREWRHIAVTFDADTRTLEAFLDGESMGTLDLRDDATQLSPTDGLVIGAHRAGGRNWEGWIDDVAIWDRKLSGDEIAYLQDNPVLPVPGDYEPPMADFEGFEAPFALDFGTGEGRDSGEALLTTPSDDPFSLGSDSLSFTVGHASAMASVENYLSRQDFTLAAELRPSQYVQPNGNDRVGLAVLGGPHAPPDDEFDTVGGTFYALTWSPAVDMTTSVIEIREGFDGPVLADAVWQGRHPSEDGATEGIGEIYELVADGIYDETGALELIFSLTDQSGYSQSLSAWIVEPAEGNLFGFGGHLESEPSGDPEVDFLSLAMAVGDEPGPVVEDPLVERPFRFAFGSDGDRDSGDSFAFQADEDWSLEGESLRLATSESDYRNSLATTRVINFSPEDEFLLDMPVTLTDFDAGAASENRVAMVLFGDQDRDVFDPDNDETYYTFQWTPNGTDGAGIAVRQGMNGEVIAETDFAELDNPPLAPSPSDPSAGIGVRYGFLFRGEFNQVGELVFRGILTDGVGGRAEVSGTMPAPDGNRFGFGGRQRAAENPAWDFHAFNWFDETWLVDYVSLEAPFTLDFGTGGDQTGLEPLLVPERLQDWSVQNDALRYASRAGDPDEPDLSWTNSAAVAVVENYLPRQDFFLATEVTMEEMGESGWTDGWQRFGFGVLGGPHSLEEPFSQNSVGYKLLMMRGEIRLIDHGVGIIAREDWDGVHENGAVYQMEASGEFDELGRLVLSLSVTDNTGHSQTVSTGPIDQPHEGHLFGFFGRDRYYDGAPPAYDYAFLSVELGEEPDPDLPDPTVSWPFYYAFGTDDGRDEATDFVRNLPDDWSLEESSLRLATGLAEAHNSLNTTRVLNFEPGDAFALRVSLTLEDLAAGANEARVGLVLLGDEEGFDAKADETFYTVQWHPDPEGSPRIAVRQGMDGDVIAETAFETVEDPPDAVVGETYAFVVQGVFDEGDLEITARLIGGNQESAAVTATIPGPLDGKNRFGFGARHTAGDGAVWDFRDFAMLESWIVDYEPLPAPFSLDFGTGEGQVGLGPLLLAERPQDWSEEEDAIRFASVAGSPDDPDLSWTDSAGVVVVENYRPGQDFFLETEVTQVRYGGGDWERFGFLALGGPHNLEDPFSPGEGFYKMLLMRGQLRLNDQPGGIIVRENWDGAYRDDPITYRIEASGVYDDLGRLELSYTFTDDEGHSQTLSTVIDEPAYDGNVFGFFFRDRYDDLSPPAYDFHNFSVTLGDDPDPDGVTFASWQEEHFTETERDDPAIGGPGAAPAGDGVANLLKYAFGLDPFTPASIGDLVESEVVDGILRLTYLERIDAVDINYVPEASMDLAVWNGGPEYVEEVDVEPVSGGEFNRVTVQAVLDGDEESAFLRVRVTAN